MTTFVDYSTVITAAWLNAVSLVAENPRIVSYAHLAPDTDMISYFDSDATVALTAFTALGRSVVGAADAAALRAAIGFGSAANEDASAFAGVSNNLSDLTDATVARDNLGLGGAAVLDAADLMVGSNNLSEITDAAAARANIGVSTGTGDVVAANNLSELTDPAVARSNLGVGTVATHAHTEYASAAQGALADSAIQSVSALMVKAANLSDVANAATARANLGLDTAATTPATNYATAAQGATANAALPKSGGTMSGNIDCGNHAVYNVSCLLDYGEYDAGTGGSSKTIDFANGKDQKLLLSAASCALTFSFPGVGHFQLRIINAAGGGDVITHSTLSATRWASSVAAPAILTGANAESVINIFWNGSAATSTQSMFHIGAA